MPTTENQTLYSDWEQVASPNPNPHCCGKTARNNDEDGDDREGECCTEALQLKNKEMMEMIAAAKAKPAESPNCLQNEELQRQVAMLMSGGGGCVPMAVVNDDDEDWVGSDLSGSSVDSVSSTTHWISTGQVEYVYRKGWLRVCKRDDYGVSRYTR